MAILYVSIYAAFNFYRLIDHGAAFTMMSGVTLIGAALADYQDAQLLALFAVGGGFLTPFLLASGGASETALFGYDAVLVTGTIFIARRRGWPALNAVSYGFTVLTVASWVLADYTPAAYLTTELFMTLFCGLFIYVLYDLRQQPDSRSQTVAFLLKSAPAAYYLASIAVLFAHPLALFAYLVALSVIGVAAGSRFGSVVRLLSLGLAATPLLLWSGTPDAQLWVNAGTTAWAVVFALNLAALWKEHCATTVRSPTPTPCTSTRTVWPLMPACIC